VSPTLGTGAEPEFQLRCGACGFIWRWTEAQLVEAQRAFELHSRGVRRRDGEPLTADDARRLTEGFAKVAVPFKKMSEAIAEAASAMLELAKLYDVPGITDGAESEDDDGPES